MLRALWVNYTRTWENNPTRLGEINHAVDQAIETDSNSWEKPSVWVCREIPLIVMSKLSDKVHDRFVETLLIDFCLQNQTVKRNVLLHNVEWLYMIFTAVLLIDIQVGGEIHFWGKFISDTCKQIKQVLDNRSPFTNVYHQRYHLLSVLKY